MALTSAEAFRRWRAMLDAERARETTLAPCGECGAIVMVRRGEHPYDAVARAHLDWCRVRATLRYVETCEGWAEARDGE